MRSWLAQYEMRNAGTLDEALTLLGRDPGVWMPFAGGTDLMVLLEAGALPPRRFLNIWPIAELRGIAVREEALTIGALTTYTDLLNNPTVLAEFPLISAAARETGAVAIQNRGTVGGNIANASPAADLPPALLAYDAEIELASLQGRRIISYDRFHTGYKQMELRSDELIVGVTVRRGRAGWKQTYRKVGTRGAQAISKVCFAAAANLAGGVIADVRIAVGSVAPTVVRARRAEAAVRGLAAGPDAVAAGRLAIADDIQPIDDLRSTASYRRLVAANLLEEFVS